jgi:hemolysin III
LSNLPEVKPKLRGVIHQITFFVTVVLGPVLVAISSAGARLGVAIYSVSLSALFGVSALYHRINWTPRVRMWMRKLDHSMIFLLIAGTFTPFGLAVSRFDWVKVVLLIVWGGALLGIALHLLPFSGSKALVVIPYLALGWLGVSLLPVAWRELGAPAPTLLIIGGVLYSLGAAAYARRSPNPRPGVFGYHEVFHAFVTAAAALHYTAIALVVVR